MVQASAMGEGWPDGLEQEPMLKITLSLDLRLQITEASQSEETETQPNSTPPTQVSADPYTPWNGPLLREGILDC